MKSGMLLAGKFELLRKLGNGAMGEVWRARDHGPMSRDVAIKLMTGVPDEDLGKRFVREAHVASELENPHILRVFDMGEHDGRLFIVMELLTGQDLAEVIKGRALPVQRAVDLAVQLADGLAAVHAANIVHRDLKPANIFVKSSGTLKICDFGIVRDNNEHGGDPTFVGTLRYMAPERLVPGDKRVAPASDLWAAGCIMYEILTGRHPFAADVDDPGELFRQVINSDPTPPRELNRQVPLTLSDTVVRLLAKSPSKRPTAADLKAELEAIQHFFGARTQTVKAELPRPVTAPIAAGSLAQGHMEVLVLPNGRELRHRWYWPDPNWSEWQDMPLPAGRATAIAVGSKDEYATEIAVAVGDTVHHRWWAGKWWSDWHEMPALGSPVADLAFSSNIADTLEIYALDERGRIRHRWWWRDAGWSDWHPMDTPGGRPATAVAAGSYADYHQELFTVVDGEIWHRWWWRNDGWSDWHQQAPVGMRAADIAVSSMKKGHLEVFAIDEGGRIRHRWYWAGHGWSEWQDFPLPDGSRVTAIAATSGSTRHQEIFGLKASGKVVHAWNWLNDDGKPDWESWSHWSEWHFMPNLP